MRNLEKDEAPVAAEAKSESQSNVSSKNILAPSGGLNKTLRLKKRKPSIPIVDAWIVNPKADWHTATFYCRHCKHRHTHGVPSAHLKFIGELLGHRRPHCDVAGSPYEETGYYLRLIDEVSP